MKPLAALFAVALCVLALAPLAPSALAQTVGTYAVVATQAELDDGGTLSGALPSCLTVDGSQPTVATFFDAASEQFVAYTLGAPEGERTAVLVSAAELDAAVGADVTACRDAELETVPFVGFPTGDVFAVLATADGRELVVRLAADGVLTVLAGPDAADGTRALTHTDGTLYLARALVDGAPDSGVYRIDAETPGQTPEVVYTDPALDPVGIGVTDAVPYSVDYLLVASGVAGANPFRNTVAAVRDFASEAPTAEVAVRPCDGPTPTFADCGDGLQGLIVDVAPLGSEYPPLRALVANRASTGADEVAEYTFFETPTPHDSTAGVFAEAALVAQTAATAFEAAPGALATETGLSPLLYLAGSDQGGGEPGLYSVVTPFSVASAPGPSASGVQVRTAPNPASDAARVALTLAEATPALTVTVVDALGRRVAVLHEGSLAPGTHAFALGADTLAPGVYVVVAEANGARHTERVVVVR